MAYEEVRQFVEVLTSRHAHSLSSYIDKITATNTLHLLRFLHLNITYFELISNIG